MNTREMLTVEQGASMRAKGFTHVTVLGSRAAVRFGEVYSKHRRADLAQAQADRLPEYHLVVKSL